MLVSDQIFNDYKNTVCSLSHKHLEEFFFNQNYINQIYQCFSDDHSKNTYINDIKFSILRQFINEDEAAHYCTFTKISDWEKSFDNTLSELDQSFCKKCAGHDKYIKYLQISDLTTDKFSYENVFSVNSDDTIFEFCNCFGASALAFNQNQAKVFSFDSNETNNKIYIDTTNNISNVSLISTKSAESDGNTIINYISSRNIIPTKIIIDYDKYDAHFLFNLLNYIDKNGITPEFIFIFESSIMNLTRSLFYIQNRFKNYKFYTKKRYPVGKTIIYLVP